MDSDLSRKSEESRRPCEFGESLMLFREGEACPFAYRAPIPPQARAGMGEGAKVLYEYGIFSVFRAECGVICSCESRPRILALFEPTEGAELDESALLAQISSELAHAGDADPNAAPAMAVLDLFVERIIRAAGFCGCLTDAYRPEEDGAPPSSCGIGGDAAFLALILPIIALMYRRLSAARGFNFRVKPSQGMNVFAFSANIISDGIERPEDIPEVSVMQELQGGGELILLTKLRGLGADGEGRRARLSLSVCSYKCDPNDVFYSLKWKEKQRELALTDIEVPGRF